MNILNFMIYLIVENSASLSEKTFNSFRMTYLVHTEKLKNLVCDCSKLPSGLDKFLGLNVGYLGAKNLQITVALLTSEGIV